MDNEREVKPMFIFSRKVGEMIRLGDDVFVRVERIWPDRVGLQVIAPKLTSVLRSEVHAAVRRDVRKGALREPTIPSAADISSSRDTP